MFILFFSDTDSQKSSSATASSNATAAGGSSTANGNVAAGSRAADDVEKVAEEVAETAQATSDQDIWRASTDVDGNSDGNANNRPSDTFTGVASNGQNENIPSKSIK